MVRLSATMRDFSSLNLKRRIMKTLHVLTVVGMTAGLIIHAGPPADAQHSSGGTAPTVTEGKGQGGSSGTQGVPGSGWNPNDKSSGSQSGAGSGAGTGSGTSSGEANSPESSTGTGYGLESGSHSEKDVRSGGQMGSSGKSGSVGSGGSGGSNSGGRSGGGR